MHALSIFFYKIKYTHLQGRLNHSAYICFFFGMDTYATDQVTGIPHFSVCFVVPMGLINHVSQSKAKYRAINYYLDCQCPLQLPFLLSLIGPKKIFAYSWLCTQCQKYAFLPWKIENQTRSHCFVILFVSEVPAKLSASSWLGSLPKANPWGMRDHKKIPSR